MLLLLFQHIRVIILDTSLTTVTKLTTVKLTYPLFQKVDIYSLGIIFFEMVYRPLSTNMERFMVLSNLRKEQILFPNDFDSNGLLRHQAELIQQMLNHNPSQRPSSKELLQSPHLPAVQEAEAEFQRRMEEAINNPESHIYRRVLAQLFSQQASTLMDMTYNMDQTKTKNVKVGGVSQV